MALSVTLPKSVIKTLIYEDLRKVRDMGLEGSSRHSIITDLTLLYEPIKFHGIGINDILNEMVKDGDIEECYITSNGEDGYKLKAEKKNNT